jgi:C1A family cysteine protease
LKTISLSSEHSLKINVFIKGLVTPVKNQMSCGSCAAFAVTGAHETCMLAGGARFNGLDLSEQYLIDCGYNPSK